MKCGIVRTAVEAIKCDINGNSMFEQETCVGHNHRFELALTPNVSALRRVFKLFVRASRVYQWDCVSGSVWKRCVGCLEAHR